MSETPMTPEVARVRLAQYGERTKTWSTATYNDGTEKALHQIAVTLLAEADALRARVAELEADLAAKAQDTEAAVKGWGRSRERVAELEAAAEQIRHLHTDSPMGPCPVCIDADAMVRGDDYTLPYPCPTARLAGAQDCDPAPRPAADGITRLTAPTQSLRDDEPAALRAEDTADILTLANAQHADATYNPAFRTISLELTATPEQWAVWQKALSVDLARTTNRGSVVTSHAVWRGIHVVIRCWFSRPGGVA